MKIKTSIEICDDSTTKDLEACGLTPKFLEIAYYQFFDNILRKTMDNSLVNYTVSVGVEE